MSENTDRDVTELLLAWRNGDEAALDALMPLIYQTLKRIAYGALNEWPTAAKEHTLEPTVLVHEAYLRLIDQHRVDWRDRSHFFAIAAREIRRILIDEYRKRNAEKRGGQFTRVTLSEAIASKATETIDLLVLNSALDELAQLDERQARIVELHFFGGHTNAEIAELLSMGLSTVERELMHARRWLRSRL